MVDRLLPPLLALTLALPMATRGPCCCLSKATAESVAGCCQAEPTCCDSAASERPCCQAKKPSCCSDEGAVDCGVLKLGRCGCSGCPSNRVTSPIQNTASSPRERTADELPQATVAVSATTPTAPATFHKSERGSSLFNRPPPDQQALLCVWTI